MSEALDDCTETSDNSFVLDSNDELDGGISLSDSTDHGRLNLRKNRTSSTKSANEVKESTQRTKGTVKLKNFKESIYVPLYLSNGKISGYVNLCESDENSDCVVYESPEDVVRPIRTQRDASLKLVKTEVDTAEAVGDETELRTSSREVPDQQGHSFDDEDKKVAIVKRIPRPVNWKRYHMSEAKLLKLVRNKRHALHRYAHLFTWENVDRLSESDRRCLLKLLSKLVESWVCRRAKRK